MSGYKYITVNFEVFGKVQGVFFRKHTLLAAKKNKCVGWIQNTETGTVTGIIQGSKNNVEKMKSWLMKEGSPLSKIDQAVFKMPAEQLWDSSTSVSNVGRKRGRGRHMRKAVNLNKGQAIGVGRNRMLWPGLNAPLLKGGSNVKIQQLPTDPDHDAKIIAIRGDPVRSRRRKLLPLERGWTGGKLGGTSLGPPDAIGDYTFEGFDTRILEFKMVSRMTGNFGRKMAFSTFVITGNKNGLAGCALAKSLNAQASMRKAKNRAAKNLEYIDRYNGHTGAGIKAHRAIKTMCQVIGINDLFAKVEGGKRNVQNMTKALFNGLRDQETHQQLADRLKLNVVEFRPEMDNIPVVVARPQQGKSCDVGITEECFDFERMYFNGRVPYIKEKYVPFYIRLNMKCWLNKYHFLNKMRNQKYAQLEREALGIEPNESEKRRRAMKLECV